MLSPDAQRLVTDLHHAFGHTEDNNRDLIGDSTFSTAEVTEELNVLWAYHYLIAYIERNHDLINNQLS